MFFFFFPIAAIALIAAHYYFYRRLVRPLSGRGQRGAGAAILLTLLFFVAFGNTISRILPGTAALYLQRAGYVWMPIALYCLFALLAIDLAIFVAWLVERVRRRKALRLPPSVAPSSAEEVLAPISAEVPEVEATFRPERRRFLKNSGLIGLGLALPTSGWGFWSAQHCQIVRRPIHLEGLSERLSGLSIALLSDIHVGGWIGRDFVQDLVDKVNALAPDAVFIAGDLVDGKVHALSSSVAPLANLRSRLGTFFVVGNHEIYSGVDPWVAFLSSLGIRVLRNECADLDGLDLLGVDDWSMARHGISPGYDLVGALAQRRHGDRPSILLTHQPRGFRDAVGQGVALQLSGHTHGGQMFPFHPFAWHANDGFLAGLYRHGKGQLYVTRGCGYWGPPARVGAPPEITHIILLPGAGATR
ncbi:MAG: metallophosphoesterase [Myxococcales bacterium]|jgi:predicted MPP superfamily phosphohydrolase|nr:metallophosphoesterase [Myxococcales bacterium]